MLKREQDRKKESARIFKNRIDKGFFVAYNGKSQKKRIDPKTQYFIKNSIERSIL